MRATALLLLLLASTAEAQRFAPPGYEAVLVPFDTGEFPGQHGTRWSAELRVRNGSDTAVNLFPENCSIFGRPVACSRRIDVPARTTMLVDVFRSLPGGGTPGGVMLYVPDSHAGDVHFSLRAREILTGFDPVGADLPVFRESQFRSGETTFVHVPLTAEVRPVLRVYTIDTRTVDFAIRLRIHREPDGELLVDLTQPRHFVTDQPFPIVEPLLIDLSHGLAAAARTGATHVTVSLEPRFPPDFRYVPLLTVTSNRDHRTTVLH